ncbi:hypothetical protein N9S81_00045 [bacterium]|nr:hypothetical protein [bacterium]
MASQPKKRALTLHRERISIHTWLNAAVTAYFLSVNHRPNLEAAWRGFIFLIFFLKNKN